MASITQFVESKLKLRVNRDKSAVARATKRPFLGFGFFVREGSVKVHIDPKALTRAKERVRRLTARSWSISMDERLQAINRFTGRLDGLLRDRRHALPLRASRRMAPQLECPRFRGHLSAGSASSGLAGRMRHHAKGIELSEAVSAGVSA
jgi:hypothetical protein